jgi:hypothetical protein
MPPLAVDASPAGACRLNGALKPGTVVGASATIKQRVRIGGAVSVTVVHKASAITLTPNLNIRGLGADATMDEANAATANTTGTATAPITTAEAATVYTCRGEEYIEVEVSSAGGTSATVAYIDVLTKRG